MMAEAGDKDGTAMVIEVVVVVVLAAVVVMISMCGLHYPPTIISYIGDPKQDHSFIRGCNYLEGIEGGYE